MSEAENSKSPSKDGEKKKSSPESASASASVPPGRKEHLPPGLHHHVVPTERAGAFSAYVQVKTIVAARERYASEPGLAMHEAQASRARKPGANERCFFS